MDFKIFHSFLSDPNVYKKTQAFWDNTVNELLPKLKKTRWIENKLPDGTKIQDGNPIYSILLPQLKKAVRIIQLPADYSTSLLSIWLNNTEDNDETVQELAFFIQLNKQSFDDAKILISSFIERTSINSLIEKTNNKYEKDFDKRQLHKLVSSKLIKNTSIRLLDFAHKQAVDLPSIDNIAKLISEASDTVKALDKARITITHFHFESNRKLKFKSSLERSLNNAIIAIASSPISISRGRKSSSKSQYYKIILQSANSFKETFEALAIEDKNK